MDIQMVDLKGQYLHIKKEIDKGILEVINNSDFINGSKVFEFAENLAKYTDSGFVIPCANGTDAIQIALMALGLKPGDEVIVPAFTYAATAEVIGLLGLTPVMVDVDYRSFNTTAEHVKKALGVKTKAIVPVHLFGQSCDMEPIMKLAEKYDLFVVEDNAQALGAKYRFSDGTEKYTGTIGHIGCTSFFPSKNLGCYGDGGAIFTDDPSLAEKLKMIANHGQKAKYYHAILGCNSRLDTIQAAILNVKLKYLNAYSAKRFQAAQYYKYGLKDIKEIIIPEEMPWSTHVYHQFTLKVLNNKRDNLKEYLAQSGIPSVVYYPLPLHEQEAFRDITISRGCLDVSKELSGCVLSLPMHTELSEIQQDIIINKIREFFT
jgi:dTDP-4-amino-4,6-dideoxygalactose transaminase